MSRLRTNGIGGGDGPVCRGRNRDRQSACLISHHDQVDAHAVDGLHLEAIDLQVLIETLCSGHGSLLLRDRS
eukprot:10889558-Heterocapsa_arctica.AAC.1